MRVPPAGCWLPCSPPDCWWLSSCPALSPPRTRRTTPWGQSFLLQTTQAEGGLCGVNQHRDTRQIGLFFLSLHILLTFSGFSVSHSIELLRERLVALIRDEEKQHDVLDTLKGSLFSRPPKKGSMLTYAKEKAKERFFQRNNWVNRDQLIENKIELIAIQTIYSMIFN